MRAAASLLLIALSFTPAIAGEVTAQVSAAVTLAPPTAAELRAEELDRLLAQLHGLNQPGTGAALEAAIEKLWMASDSATAEVLLQQATAALEAGDSDPSLQLLDQVTAAYPNFAEAWNKRAVLHYKLGQLDAALADIDKVLALEPRHFGALAGRGMILAEQRKFGAALAALNEALAVNPQMAEVKAAIAVLNKMQRAL